MSKKSSLALFEIDETVLLLIDLIKNNDLNPTIWIEIIKEYLRLKKK